MLQLLSTSSSSSTSPSSSSQLSLFRGPHLYHLRIQHANLHHLHYFSSSLLTCYELTFSTFPSFILFASLVHLPSIFIRRRFQLYRKLLLQTNCHLISSPCHLVISHIFPCDIPILFVSASHTRFPA